MQIYRCFRIFRSCLFVVKPFCVQPFREVVGDLDVVEVGEREVGVAVQTDFGEVNHGGITTIFIDQSGPLAHQVEAAGPFVEFRTLRGLREVVAVIDDDWDSGESQKDVHRDFHAFRLYGKGTDLALLRHLTFRKRDIAFRLVSDYRSDVLGFREREPADTTALRMGYEYSRPDLVEQGSISLGIDIQVRWSPPRGASGDTRSGWPSRGRRYAPF